MSYVWCSSTRSLTANKKQERAKRCRSRAERCLLQIQLVGRHLTLGNPLPALVVDDKTSCSKQSFVTFNVPALIVQKKKVHKVLQNCTQVSFASSDVRCRMYHFLLLFAKCPYAVLLGFLPGLDSWPDRCDTFCFSRSTKYSCPSKLTRATEKTSVPARKTYAISPCSPMPLQSYCKSLKIFFQQELETRARPRLQ